MKLKHVAPVPNLEDLAAGAIAEHEAYTRTHGAMLEHARRCGELLMQAKHAVRHGGWLPWLAVHCPSISPRSAQGYMQVARRWSEVSTDARLVAHLRATLALLARPRKTDRTAAVAALPPDPGTSNIITGDLADVTDIAPGTVDAIITDPAYGREYLGLYDTLGRRAPEWLRPGGSLICMAGQAHLPDVMRSLGAHLTYRWTLAYLTPDRSCHVHGRSIFCEWKPVLWYTHGRYSGPYVADVVTSGAREKSLHDWQQSESGFAALVERFTRPGDLVLDPFCGSGTTGAAALRLGRRFIGIEVDGATADVARRRLADLGRELEGAA